MNAPTRIYLSPHLDDVVLSCGGTLYTQSQQGQKVQVVTFFAGSPPRTDLTPFTKELQERWGNAKEPMAIRRQEDRAALTILGAQPCHLSFLDCVYRQHPSTGQPLYPTEESIFGEIHPSEDLFHYTLCQTFLETVSPSTESTIYAPLGAGQHVDHILIYRVALLLLQQGFQVLFYEDYPYAAESQETAQALQRWPRECWVSQLVSLQPDALEAKIAAIARYASQISTFWSDLSEMRQALYQYTLAVGGGRYAERFWELTFPRSRAEASPS